MTTLIQRVLIALLISVSLTSTSYAANRIHFVINNHLGAPEMLLDEDQNVVWQAEYDEFGEATILVEEVEFNHRFPGQYYDKETGLSYNYYRDYDPSTGRYVQSDPIGLKGGINTYGYVGGNPVNYVDPTGEAANLITGLIGGTVGGIVAIGQNITSMYVYNQPFQPINFLGDLAGGMVGGACLGATGNVPACSSLGISIGYAGMVGQSWLDNAIKNSNQSSDANKNSTSCEIEKLPNMGSISSPDCKFIFDPLTNSTNVICADYY